MLLGVVGVVFFDLVFGKQKKKWKNSFRWVLGSGEDIIMFEDVWLRGKENYRVDSNYISRDDIAKVKDLSVPDVRAWENTKVNNMLRQF